MGCSERTAKKHRSSKNRLWFRCGVEGLLIVVLDEGSYLPLVVGEENRVLKRGNGRAYIYDFAVNTTVHQSLGTQGLNNESSSDNVTRLLAFEA